MKIFPSFAGSIGPWPYAFLAPTLVLSQNAVVALCYHLAGTKLILDAEFWFLPLRRLAQMPGLSSKEAAGAFAFALIIAWALALVSFRRAEWSGRGHAIAGFSIVPALQLPAIIILAFMPHYQIEQSAEPADPDVRLGDIRKL